MNDTLILQAKAAATTAMRAPLQDGDRARGAATDDVVERHSERSLASRGDQFTEREA
jgi:hypothetical protein